jgi:uncharacterized protein (TIGR02001 family)
MKKSLVAAGLALSAVTLTPAFAEEAKKEEAAPAPALTGNFTIASEYRYRGIAQTNKKPAFQGGLDYAHESGFYVGTWGSNVSWISDTPPTKPSATGSVTASASLEWDIYGGYKGTIGDFGYDVGLLYYYYPGTYSANVVSPNTTELYVAGTYGTTTLKYSHSLSNIFGFYDSKGAGYLDLTTTVELPEGFNLTAHVGNQSIPSSTAAGRSGSVASYSDWKLGVTKEIAGLTYGAAYIGTNAKAAAYTSALNKDLGKGTVVFTVGKTF